MPEKLPVMIDPRMLEQTGIISYYKKALAQGGSKLPLKDQMRILMRIVDEEDAIGRFEWKNLPQNFTLQSDDIERLIYFRGQLVFFYFEPLDKFYLMPYSGCDIEFYGRYTYVTPVPVATSAENDNYDAQKEMLSALKLKAFYTMPTDKEIEEAGGINKIGIIIRDYDCQMSAQYIIPRNELNEPLLDIESEMFPIARTSRIASSGVKGMRVPDGSASDHVKEANNKMYEAAISGEPFVPIECPVEFQELNEGNVSKNENYMLDLQTAENFRLSTYGIENGGLFNKKSHELENEAKLNSGPVRARLKRCLNKRTDSVKIINKIWSLNILVDISDEIEEHNTMTEGEKGDNKNELANDEQE